MNFDVLLLAAGFGTRLKPLTNDWPKCLMPIHGYPLLGYWLDYLVACGIKRVFVNTHFHREIVSSFIKREIYRKYVNEFYEPQLLGTAGTIRAVRNSFDVDRPLLVIHADNFCNLDIYSIATQTEKIFKDPYDLVMLTFKTRSPGSCGICTVDKGVLIGFEEKPENPTSNLANAAVYFLHPRCLDWLRERTFIRDISTQVIPAFLGKIRVLEHTGFMHDIGTPAAFRRAQSDHWFPVDNRNLTDDWMLSQRYQLSKLAGILVDA
jgi:mannose-1-phosphate guanylyltransferase